MSLALLKKDLKKKNIVFGTNKTIKELKNGKIERVYMSSNCPNNVRSDILYYSKIAGIKVIELKENNEELAVICKKPFSVSILSLLK
ncbi:MAG: ribosomal L7Ae/L30e/S12e/Gadd45 family protein [Nanoarchaeota archaeon]